MSSLENQPEWAPDLGDASPLTSGPKRGLRAQAERSFISMVQAAFLQNEEFRYSPKDGEGRLYVQSAVSNENQAFMPRVEVKVGPLSEYDGSINNLEEWSKSLDRRLYVDQAQVVFVCTAEEEAEASDLGERVRRVLDLAKSDLGERGIFGILNPELTAPKPARPGTEQDDAYQSLVKAPFMTVERQERHPDPDNPLGTEFGGTARFIADSTGVEDGQFDPETDTEDPDDSTATVESAVARRFSRGTKITLRLSKRMGTHQISGITVTIGPDTVDPYAIRNNQDFREINVEASRSVPAGTPVAISYDPGNLEDYDNRPVPSFGPVDVTWA